MIYCYMSYGHVNSGLRMRIVNLQRVKLNISYIGLEKNMTVSDLIALINKSQTSSIRIKY